MSTPTSIDYEKALDLIRAGQWNDAHELVQTAEGTPLADWLHGILHLQEGDLGNAGYWYRRAGREFQAHGSVEQELDAFEANFDAGSRGRTS